MDSGELSLDDTSSLSLDTGEVQAQVAKGLQRPKPEPGKTLPEPPAFDAADLPVARPVVRFVEKPDQDTAARLDNLEDPYRLFRCHTIMNCVDVCPKGLNPTKAIGKIKEMMVMRSI